MVSPVKLWRNKKKVSELLNKQGEILSWTRIHIPPAGFESLAPYYVAIVKLENGRKITAQLVGENDSEPYIGQKVVTVLRRTRNAGMESVIPYGIKVKLIV